MCLRNILDRIIRVALKLWGKTASHSKVPLTDFKDFMKQVIVIRKDLNMRKGKMVAQGSHASLGAYLRTSGSDQKKWMSTGQTKICVSVDSEEQLLEIFALAGKANLPTVIIRDAGHTELEPNTLTAVGIGPCEEGDVDPITGKLKLL